MRFWDFRCQGHYQEVSAFVHVAILTKFLFEVLKVDLSDRHTADGSEIR